MQRDEGSRILVIEDDADHRLLISIAFERGDPTAEIHHTQRADEAVAHLMGLRQRLLLGEGADEVPNVIVLDLSMPGMSGMEFLMWQAEQADWIQHIPVIVFTSSDDPALARECFALGAREFKEKPSDFGELVTLTREVLEKWSPRHHDMG